MRYIRSHGSGVVLCLLSPSIGYLQTIDRTDDTFCCNIKNEIKKIFNLTLCT